MTGATLEYNFFENSYDDTITHEGLKKLLKQNLIDLGLNPVEKTAEFAAGSTDVGNVSHKCPTIYAEIDVEAEDNASAHEVTFLKYVHGQKADKTLEKALLKSEKELGISKEEFIYTEKNEKVGILKSNKIIITVIKKSDIIAEIKNYFENLSKNLGIKIESNVYFDEDHIKINLTSDNSSALIGKNGKMLNSIQILLKRSLEIKTNTQLKVYLDIEEYKERKIKKLENNIRNIVKEVLETKLDVKLDEMNSFERRIVHNIVSEYENLISESEGEAPHRYVVIKYIER